MRLNEKAQDYFLDHNAIEIENPTAIKIERVDARTWIIAIVDEVEGEACSIKLRVARNILNKPADEIVASMELESL